MKAHLKLIIALIAFAICNKAIAADIECYDAKIRAKPIAQIPTVLGDSGEDIIIYWPWFLDLKIKRVIEGEVPEREITILALMHSYFREKTLTMLLRRNTAGTFNLIRAEPSSIRRCEAGSEPVPPYLRPGDGKTLDDYRREGEEELNGINKK
ncbi:hypothetical protein LPB140_10545 [Sphingorhabdus lutea]|uniref:Uncharacterized protein n=1 Tax=Sphingorhabdus lutea TaxID=1913578 RepID=A0A1L3JDF3_9SPHN|nr:hypothetical protein [Sphingorhabdus lutea]APG63155.1 hypothetical protein LPB140_10545 [Sphingorhabdus lutea]